MGTEGGREVMGYIITAIAFYWLGAFAQRSANAVNEALVRIFERVIERARKRNGEAGK